MTARFSPRVEAELRAAGWFEGRRTDISIWDTFPMRPFAAAREVLVEFGGLRIGDTGPGTDFARSDVDLTPTWTNLSFDGYHDLERLVGQLLYPLGQVHRRNGELLIDETGTMYLLWEELMHVAPSFDQGLELLLLGKNFMPPTPPAGS